MAEQEDNAGLTHTIDTSGTAGKPVGEQMDEMLASKHEEQRAGAEEDEDRPSGNATEEEWREYRLNHGYAEDELEGKGRNDLRDMTDR